MVAGRHHGFVSEKDGTGIWTDVAEWRNHATGGAGPVISEDET